MSEADFYDSIWKVVYKERKTTRRIHWERIDDLARVVSRHVVGSVLDLGCGFGHLSKFVVGPYLGVDLSPYVIKVAGKEHPQGKFTVGDIRSYHSDTMYDTVVMMQVLEHLKDRQQATELARALARKRIVVSVPRGRSRSEDHVWQDIEKQDVLDLLGPGSTCRQYRRKWIGIWERKGAA